MERKFILTKDNIFQVEFFVERIPVMSLEGRVIDEQKRVVYTVRLRENEKAKLKQESLTRKPIRFDLLKNTYFNDIYILNTKLNLFWGIERKIDGVLWSEKTKHFYIDNCQTNFWYKYLLAASKDLRDLLFCEDTNSVKRFEINSVFRCLNKSIKYLMFDYR